MAETLRKRVRAGEVVVGAFIKTASHASAEVLGRSGLDFAVIDAEHAPFDLAAIDQVALGARSAGLPCLVRPPDGHASFIGACLDLGAAGILGPHVASAQAALALVAAAKFEGGKRGFSPSTRAGGYGTLAPADYRRAADEASCLWCQIEDEEALHRLDEIAAVDQIDALFIGRADLALSLGADGPDDPKVVEAVRATAQAGRRRGRTVGIYIGDTGEVPDLLALGITLFICGSDQSLLMAKARQVRGEVDAACGQAAR